MYRLNSKGRVLIIDQPIVMGIMNATPDSFHEGSRVSLQEIVDVAGKMLNEGAQILDIGGQSTRPGAEQIGSVIEAERVIPAIESIRKTFPDCWISIDTYHAAVAKAAIEGGADIVNDVSAGDDDMGMIPLVSELRVPYIAMHKKGKPETMQQNPQYDDVLDEVLSYFVQKKAQLEHAEIMDWVLDLGFGFGKTLEQNFTLFKHLKDFQTFDRPILVGISRKGMIQKTLNVDANNALNGTTALHMAALLNGANILRVHDVMAAVECITLFKMLG
jgi:dihydropteroate synthase